MDPAFVVSLHVIHTDWHASRNLKHTAHLEGPTEQSTYSQ
jgi:hypothetical protein